MLDDEDIKRSGKGPKPLDDMSVSELRDYIAALKQEIQRAETEIEKKEAHKNVASSVFKS